MVIFSRFHSSLMEEVFQIEFISIDSYTSTLPMFGTCQNRILIYNENMCELVTIENKARSRCEICKKKTCPFFQLTIRVQ